MRRLCADVERAGGDDKARLFAEFEQELNVHERGEQVVHAATRQATAKGDEIGRARMAEERKIEWAIGELHGLGAGNGDFDARFADLHRAIVEHMAREERDEFPLLRRYLPAGLYRLAGEVQDIQIMTVR
jgi:hypothetical protein